MQILPGIYAFVYCNIVATTPYQLETMVAGCVGIGLRDRGSGNGDQRAGNQPGDLMRLVPDIQ